MQLFPAEVEWEEFVFPRLSYRNNQRMEMEYSKKPQLWDQLEGVWIPTLAPASGVASGKSPNTSKPSFLFY